MIRYFANMVPDLIIFCVRADVAQTVLVKNKFCNTEVMSSNPLWMLYRVGVMLRANLYLETRVFSCKYCII